MPLTQVQGAMVGPTGFANLSGITFPATQVPSTDANTLDDYEEGTWTPSVLFGGAAAGQSGTFSGFYTKIGNQVFVTCLINLSARGSSTGGVAIGGLPFTANSNVNYRAMSSTVIWANFASTYVYVLGLVGASYTTIDIYAVASANTSSVAYQPTQADLTNTTQFRISLTYQV